MMIEKDDWRLLNDVEHLYNKEIVPTDGEEIFHHMLELKKHLLLESSRKY